MLPLRRRRKLVIEELADETLVYDETRHKAHCLNRTAAFVWKRCDGQTTVEQLAALLSRARGVPVEAEIVSEALEDLRRARLLEEGPAEWKPMTRRRLAGRLAVAGLASVIASVVAPTAAQATSVGDCCNTVSQCRAGLNCVGSGHPECARCPTGKCCV
jgi:hypothetical protein